MVTRRIGTPRAGVKPGRAETVQDGDRPLEIPRKEIATLECLFERRGRIVSKPQLMAHVYGTGADVEDRAIEPHVSRLRKRLESYGVRIKTARGLGYMLDVDGA